MKVIKGCYEEIMNFVWELKIAAGTELENKKGKEIFSYISQKKTHGDST